MKIVRNDVKETKFSEVAVGAVFIEEDIVYMKTSDFYEIEGDDCDYEEEHHYMYNAIGLGNGTFNCFSDWDMVRVCNDAHLVVN